MGCSAVVLPPAAAGAVDSGDAASGPVAMGRLAAGLGPRGSGRPLPAGGGVRSAGTNKDSVGPLSRDPGRCSGPRSVGAPKEKPARASPRSEMTGSSLGGPTSSKGDSVSATPPAPAVGGRSTCCNSRCFAAAATSCSRRWAAAMRGFHFLLYGFSPLTPRYRPSSLPVPLAAALAAAAPLLLTAEAGEGGVLTPTPPLLPPVGVPTPLALPVGVAPPEHNAPTEEPRLRGRGVDTTAATADTDDADAAATAAKARTAEGGRLPSSWPANGGGRRGVRGVRATGAGSKGCEGCTATASVNCGGAAAAAGEGALPSTGSRLVLVSCNAAGCSQALPTPPTPLSGAAARLPPPKWLFASSASARSSHGNG